MSRSSNLMAFVFLLMSFAGTYPNWTAADEDRNQEATARTALAASIPRRERALSQRRREDVAAEVAQRAMEMGVTASVDVMTELLLQKAWLELYIDKCKLRNDQSTYCRRLLQASANVERKFHDLAGLSMDEFKRGRPNQHPLGGITLYSTTPSPYYCQCDVFIYSSNRWMDPYWALECNGHGGHGYCSNNVDSGHSPGSGAMTGTIFVSLGASNRSLECPDDGRTCFKGPTPDGEWYNACSCDFSHFYAAYSLADSEEVLQLGISEWKVDGLCDYSGLTVIEDIYEHDPGCCDDYMGTLWPGAQSGEGWHQVITQTSFTNCNGGSQSGVPPYCGSFGATLRVVSSCQTNLDDGEGSCMGYCGTYPPDASCRCDRMCIYRLDCCSDFETVCGVY